jgi:hypothetical protein
MVPISEEEREELVKMQRKAADATCLLRLEKRRGGWPWSASMRKLVGS